MRRALLALAALAPLAQVGNAAAAGEFSLLSPSGPVTGPPPLGPGVVVQQSAAAPQAQAEVRVPGNLTSRESIVVGIGADGRPVRVTVTHRLRIDGTGDYTFLVPAPATKVTPGPGSQSLPGLRDVGILWQGFSDRRRVLSATATLRPGDAAKGLPLRVGVERTGDSATVRLENVTRRQISAVTSTASRAAVLAALAKLRAASGPSNIGGGPWYVIGTAHDATKVDVAAPLRVTGVIAQGTQRLPVDTLLGGGRPLARSFVLDGSGVPSLRLRVAMPPPIEMLPTRREIARAAHPLAKLQSTLAEIATASAYRHYLGTPQLLNTNDPVAPSDATFVYRSTPRVAAVAKPARSGGSDTLAILLAAGLGALGLVGLAAWWARS